MRRFCWQLAVGAFSLALAAASAHALPRMTLMAGSRCSNCHVNPQGSGTRTEFGFYSMAQNGAITWDKVGWQAFHELGDNRLFDGRVTLGMDTRVQMAKFGVPHWDENGVKVDPGRLVIPMQQTFGAALKITETLSAAASLNVAHFFHKYAGQSPFDAWLRFAPDAELPSIRAGMLQPSVGVRHDDHTMLLRRNVFQPGLPLLAPYWNELGAEISYEGLHWLSVEAGAFNATNLALTCSESVKPTDLIASGRLTLWPQVLDWGLNSWLGGSFLKAGDLTIMGGHVGVGKTYWGTIIGEVLISKTVQKRDIMSAMVHLAYPIQDWLVVETRYEISNGSRPAGTTTETAAMTSWVAGVQFVPLPNVELRPEYRLMKLKDNWTVGQYTAQLHLWF